MVPVAAVTPAVEVYLDHNATTPVDPAVLETMLPFLRDEWGNPSSIHGKGSRARRPVEDARRSVATSLGCTARRVVFTSGGTEANNLALRWVTSGHVITSAIEHPAVLATCRALERTGVEVTVLPVDADGLVRPDDLRHALRPDTRLVSVMTANNETGAVQPIRELAALAHQRGALFHTDAVQALGKLPLDVEALGVDLLSVSAHKVYGPKGVGALYVRAGVELPPLLCGGGQERGLRSGTENVPGIVGFGKACELARQRLLAGEAARLSTLRDRLEAGIVALLPGTIRNGPREPRLANTLSLSLSDIRGEALVLELDRRGLYLSSGSACKSGNPDPSHALLAMGLDAEQAHRTIRLSLGHRNTESDVDRLLEALTEAIEDTFQAIRFVGCR